MLEQENLPPYWQGLEFAYAASLSSQLPPVTTPEVAFWGRSNVGKSTLLNALTGRKHLARTSKTPGCTKTINFFTNRKRNYYLVDLPGYSYAAASKTARKSWSQLSADYVYGRASLLRVMLLIDARRQLMKQDQEVMSLCDKCGVSYQLVLTKIDVATSNSLAELQQQISAIADRHTAMHPQCLLTSSKLKQGLPELRDEIEAVVNVSRIKASE